MKTNQLPLVAALLALMTGLTFGQAPRATFQVGDPAPRLQASKWVQGDPVKEFERDTVYLVEFWATWCGPCRVSIPHLNELQTKFKNKGLIVIGQDVWERDLNRVEPFVKEMGSKMTYRVALDTMAEGGEGRMAQTWMQAAGRNGIPTAFLVDKRGIVAWIGHPMQLKEALLEEVLAGTFNTAKAAAEYENRRETEQRARTLWNEFNRRVEDEKWDLAEATLAEIEKLLPEDERGSVVLRRFELLLDRKDYPRAYQIAGQLSDGHRDNPMMQNEIAWQIATKEGLAERDLDLAEKIARRAAAIVKDNPSDKAEILDTLARVLFLKGQKRPAIDLQEQAVKLAEGTRKKQFQKNLDDYHADRVPNEARINALRRVISVGIQKEDWAKAESALAELAKLLPEDERGSLDSDRFRVLVGRKDYADASKLADQWSDASADGAMTLNRLAWEIAIREGIEERVLDLAEKTARRAAAIVKDNPSEKAEILDTLARVLFLKGQKEPAIELQQKAVELAAGRRKEQFQVTLDSYRQGQRPKAY